MSAAGVIQASNLPRRLGDSLFGRAVSRDGEVHPSAGAGDSVVSKAKNIGLVACNPKASTGGRCGHVEARARPVRDGRVRWTVEPVRVLTLVGSFRARRSRGSSVFGAARVCGAGRCVLVVITPAIGCDKISNHLVNVGMEILDSNDPFCTARSCRLPPTSGIGGALASGETVDSRVLADVHLKKPGRSGLGGPIPGGTG